MDVLLKALTDPNVMQKLGAQFAKGFKEGGNMGGFSSLNPTGEGNSGGRSGGSSLRDERKTIENAIKTRQLESKFVNQVTKNLKILNQEIKKSESDFAGAGEYAERFSNIFGQVWNDAMEQVSLSKKAEIRMVTALNKALDQDIETIGDVLKVRQRQQQLEKQIMDKTIATSKSMIDEYNELSTALGSATHGLSDLGKSTHDWITRGVRGFFSLEAALINLGRSVNRLVDDYKTQLAVGSHMTTVQSQWAAIMSGTDPRQFVQMMGNARQASLTFKSVGEYSDLVSQQQSKYFNQIGDLTDASQFAHDSFMMLGKSGVRPTAAAMDQTAQTFRVLNKIAGVTSEQFSQLMDQTLADVDIQTRLRVAKQGERAAIIAGIQKQIEMNVAMGLTVEQATAAAVAMGKIAGGGAKERFKRAAQMQMAFGALGVSGGARAAELTRKGNARMSPEERAELEKLTTNLTQAATATRGGSIAGELVTDTIMDKTGLVQFFGPDSPLNKQLGEGLRPLPGLLEQIRDKITDQMSTGEKLLAASQIVGNFLQSGLGGVITSVIQGIGAVWVLGAIAKLGLGGAITAIGTSLGAAAVAAAPIAGAVIALTGALAAGYKFGEWLNSYPERFGWDSYSTNLGDLVDNITGNAYDPNEGVQEAINQRRMAREVAEAQLLQAEKHTATMETVALLTAKQIDATEFAARIARIGAMGQSTGLSNN